MKTFADKIIYGDFYTVDEKNPKAQAAAIADGKFIVFFWFFGDRMFEYLFITRYELHKEQRLAGRLASIKVNFSDTYEKPHYTEEQISRLYAELDLEQ